MLISLTDLEGNSTPGVHFELGAVVVHRLYNYRGVIVACDNQCMAGDKWYHANKTKPSRNQPWYHILVHESGGLSTYVAQSNLDLDLSGEEIVHPRLNSYFDGFHDGRYIIKPSSSGSCSI